MIASLIATYIFAPANPQEIADLVTPIKSATSLTQAEKDAMKKAIGTSRMVMLGEQTHGDGTSFLMKNEMVKFLHEEMGFNVLAWESGFYDCEVMDDELSGDKPIGEVAKLGPFEIWSESVEALPVFEYGRATKKTKTPLQMTGFDIQTSGDASRQLFETFLQWFEGTDMLPAADREVIEKLIVESNVIFKGDDDDAVLAIEIRNYKSTELLLAAATKDPNKTKAAWGKAYDLRMKTLQNARVIGDHMEIFERVQLREDYYAHSYNLRERGNAANLFWLLNHYYKGEKIIVWAHNVHIFRGYPNHGADTGQIMDKMVVDSMTRIVGNELKNDLFSIGIVASGGQWAWPGRPPADFIAAPEDTIESQIAKLGHDFAFVNLRGATLIPDHPLNKPQKLLMNRQQYPKRALNMIWPQGYDGLLYIRDMKPRTQIKE